MAAVIDADSAVPRTAAAPRPLALWLLLCCGMIFAMVVIGAITRLTESGLSIAEWRPLVGALPPLSDAEWHRVFDLYRQTPQYRLVNAGMSLPEFKIIFFWEWLHRLWGRLIGIVFLAPFLWFWLTRRIPRGLWPRLLGLFLLGALQGAVGWFMVASGLVDRPAVSHYRLALHLGIAVVIYALMVRMALGLLYPHGGVVTAPGAAPGLRRHARAALALVAATMVWGAFTAGLRAGLIYNTFPLMDGHWAPPEFWALSPWWINPLENHAAVQFVHRVLALTTAASVLALGWRGLRAGLPPRASRLFAAVAAMAAAQVGLGIGTVVSQVWIPAAVLHQAGALVLVTLLVWLLFEVRAPREREAPLAAVSS